MKLTILLIAMLAASPAASHVDSDHCSNATSADAAFSQLYMSLEGVALFCENRTTDECDLIRETLVQFDETERGLGLVALRWSAIQACEG